MCNIMKYTFKFFQIFLLICGVFGVDGDEVKSVSVMEGDSVTLNTEVTKTQRIILIEWRFGEKGSTIAQIDGKDISYPSHTDIFRGKLQLDQTGSLTIKNMRIKHSGLYQLQIDLKSGSSSMTFSVTVYESPSVIDAGEAEMKTVSVMVGDSVTLQTDVTETHGDELIVWRFGDKGKLIAKHDIEAKSSPLHDTDERFRDGLKLDHQTGSLIITNTRNTDSGVYTVKISSNKQTLYKRFIVTVSGLSPGAVAGIVIVVMLVFAAAAAAGVIYYRRKISELERKLTTLSVIEGDPATLNTDVPEIHRDDVIECRFGGLLIAEIRGGIPEIYDSGLDERFLDRLKLDKKTGSLTIKNTRNTDVGLYELKICRDRKIKYKKFHVSVGVNTVSVFEGDPVIIKTDTEIQRGDHIEWTFGVGGPFRAEIVGGDILIYDYSTDRRFKDRLDLDKKTGFLTISDTEMKHSGVYQLQITSTRGISYKKFNVVVKKRNIEVREGKNMILISETEIQKDELIVWRFGDENSLIAEITGGTIKTHDGDADERFRGKLKLDEETGSLIVTDVRTEHSGVYKRQINRSRGTTKTFVVTVYLRNITVKEGNNVTVKNTTEIQKDDLIRWMFGDQDILIAEIRGGTIKTHDDVADGIFRGKLKLDEETGSLIVTDMRTEHAGEYKLQINSSRGTTKTFVVAVYRKTLSKCEGDHVILQTDTEIHRDDLIQWRFGDRGYLIATIKGGTISIYDDVPDERFRGRLKLDEETGSLTITHMRTTDSGDYKLKIKSNSGVSYKTFRVDVRQHFNESTTQDHRGASEIFNDSTIQDHRGASEMPLLNEEDLDVVNEQEGTSLLLKR
ncbi:uncharacterized protein LOC143735406 [Siphateles boraxobius]|uniref:uncharacterized protein LOC143735406 n=1 Tax=Siphateles boraxobius TaxID=180520 RepID=UPI0040638EB2